MKNTIKIAGYIGIILLFISCNKESTFHVSQEVEDTFNEMYPNASYLEWDMIDGYVVGEFRNGGYYCKAWFNSDGKWLMTETSNLNYDKLSDVIKSNFESSYYNPKNIKDIYKVEFTLLETRYIIDVEGGNTYNYLFYLGTTGELFKQVSDKWNNRPIIIPQQILNYISGHHSADTRIFDVNIHTHFTEIRIIDNSKKTLLFTSPSQWLATYWRVNEQEVPAIVNSKLRELYPYAVVDLVYHLQYETVEGNIYAFKINSKAEFIYIKEDGVQIEIENDFLNIL